MDPAEHRLALKVLKELLLGARVIGLRFAFDPIIHFDRDSDGNDFSYLRIESGFEVTAGDTTPWRQLSNRPPWDTGWLQLATLARRHIITVTLGTDVAHLSLGLDDGKQLRVHGSDPLYESWQVGAATGDTRTVVALASGEVAVWT